jgi:hypothetical protein
LRRRVNLAKAIPERWVVAIWQSELPGRTDLITEEGEPIRILYPGRLKAYEKSTGDKPLPGQLSPATAGAHPHLKTLCSQGKCYQCPIAGVAD